jgi:hypothetical protein
MEFLSLHVSVNEKGELIAFDKLLIQGVEKRNDINGHLFWLY